MAKVFIENEQSDHDVVTQAAAELPQHLLADLAGFARLLREQQDAETKREAGK